MLARKTIRAIKILARVANNATRDLFILSSIAFVWLYRVQYKVRGKLFKGKMYVT